MARRLLAFAIAFVVIGAPLAGDVCGAVCAEHAGHSIHSTVPTSHYHHAAEVVRQPSHHHDSDGAPALVTRSARLMPLAHECGHLEAVLTASREPTRAPIITAVVTMARSAPRLVHGLAESEMKSRHGPPAQIPSASPLRI